MMDDLEYAFVIVQKAIAGSSDDLGKILIHRRGDLGDFINCRCQITPIESYEEIGDEDGGFLVPPEFREMAKRVMEGKTIIRFERDDSIRNRLQQIMLSMLEDLIQKGERKMKWRKAMVLNKEAQTFGPDPIDFRDLKKDDVFFLLEPNGDQVVNGQTYKATGDPERLDAVGNFTIDCQLVMLSIPNS